MIDTGLAGPARAGGATDEEIVRRVVEGERALFEVLMRRHNPAVYRAVRSVLRDEGEVEDAMQQAYLRAYLHLADFEGASAFSTWLVRIALNEALARVRGRGRLVPVEALPEEPDGPAAPVSPANPEDRAAAREAMALLEKAIDRLPLRYRTVYVLREVQGMSTADAARALDLTEDLVKVRLHRARVALRDLLAAALREQAPEAFPFLAPRCDRVVAGVLAALARR